MWGKDYSPPAYNFAHPLMRGVVRKCVLLHCSSTFNVKQNSTFMLSADLLGMHRAELMYIFRYSSLLIRVRVSRYLSERVLLNVILLPTYQVKSDVICSMKSEV